MARDRASRPEAKPLRLFVAVDVPDGVRALLAETVAPLRDALHGRWTPPQNWHVTMKFLGRTWPRLLDWVTESCETTAASHGALRSSLSGLGAFPSSRRARVLWAGLEDPESRLAGIAGDLDEVLAAEVKVEKRGFTP